MNQNKSIYAILLRNIVRPILQLLFRVELRGFENYPHHESRLMVIANHVSLLDGALLSCFLPQIPIFVVNKTMAQRWWVKPFVKLTGFVPIDRESPQFIKVLIDHIKKGERVAIFPEGRITVTGSLMKTYEGPAVAALKADATVVPVYIEGAQHSMMSYLHGKLRRQLFPKIRLTMLPSTKFVPKEGVSSRQQRQALSLQLHDLMEKMAYRGMQHCPTTIEAVAEGMKRHGAGRKILEDSKRVPLSYRQLFIRTFVLDQLLHQDSGDERHVALLLPNSIAVVVSFLALQIRTRVPIILNFTVGARGLISACETAHVKTVYTSKAFIKGAKLDQAIDALGQSVRVVYLEDLASNATVAIKWRALMGAMNPTRYYRKLAGPVKSSDTAVILFTSGSEGHPKGVVLSHSNLIANCAQSRARLDLRQSDVIFNGMPVFHSFGLTAGTILPLLQGLRLFLYPSPLHYHVIPELIYEMGASILFGTNTFLMGYGRNAHTYDFYNIRMVVAGAEQLRQETRDLWFDRFGVRILEGYGVTEASPVLAVNSDKYYQYGSVGRFLAGIDYRLEPVEGIESGGRLYVRGDNIMQGYLLHDNPNGLITPETSYGQGWYDTGDIVNIDDQGFITILGRAKRFAKIGGEMVSLTVVEQLAKDAWPEEEHAAHNLSDPQKGEQIVLLTTRDHCQRRDLSQAAKTAQVSELHVPKHFFTVEAIPLLGSGKTDYGKLRELAEQLSSQPKHDKKSD